ncbi:ComEC/Rec2 family competence protein [Litorihabitans aurantiacus]|uniref:Competence protein ComEC n=1 Tax=Litorihabitans aurantiacus TaxID=1930061 RepID=A0AA37UQY0_9MICO|nr:ComEC/Rec2 family competence protein [Litorihabitans aurantiacus]GMA30938.1 competence protein ComEC [Litorihabitans aurantiacus]
MSGTRPARQDLRLVGPALTAWGAAALAVGLSTPGRLALVAGGAALGALAVWRGTRPARARHRDRWQTGTPTLALAALLVALVVASVAAQDALRTRGVAEALAWSGSADVVLRTSEPASPLASSGPDGAARVILEATLTGLEVRGHEIGARAPVLVIGSAAWSEVVPGSVVHARVRLRPTEPGERPVALVLADTPAVATGPPWWRAASHAVRTGLLAATDGLPPHAALLPGIGVGDDSRVPPDLADAMRATSLGHLLAVSGAHIAIVLTGVLVATASLGRTGRAACCVAVLVALVALVGPDPSVVRAVTMGGVVVLALVLGRRASALPALGSAVVLLVLVDPWIAREIGFALSVSATAGLVLGAGPLTEVLARRVPPVVAPAIAVPLAAQLACLPVLVLVDPGVATYGVLANALVAPVIAPVTVLALLAAAASTWWAAGAHGLLWVAQGGTWWIDQVARRGAELPLARLPWPPGWVGTALLLGVVVVVVALARTRAGRALLARLEGRWSALLLGAGGAVAAVACAAALVAPWRPALVRVATPVVEPAFPPPDWRLVQCDVGQGSALLISTAAGGGGGSAVMVDVGPPDGDVAGCLADVGITRLERLVLTHADADHVGGLAAVLGAVVVERALVPRTTDPRAAGVVRALTDAGVAVEETVVATDADGGATAPHDVVGAADLRVLWPTDRAVQLADPDDANDLSLTLWVQAPELSVLVHGDLGASAQQGLVRTWPGLLERPPDVVVVAHHGSADQDPALLTAAAGRLALVSVGADNDYGHPASVTSDTLTAAGAVVVRTDRCGAVAVAGASRGSGAHGTGTGAGDGDGALIVSGCRADLGAAAGPGAGTGVGAGAGPGAGIDARSFAAARAGGPS